MGTNNISALPLDNFVSIQDVDGRTVLIFEYGNDEKMGFVLPPGSEAERVGALVEHERLKPSSAGSDGGKEVRVIEHEIGTGDDDNVFLRVASEGGSMITFNFGLRRARRIRDALSGMIEQIERKGAN